MLLVYALWRIFTTHKSVYISYQMKAKIIYVMSRGYKNMSFYEKLTNFKMVLRQMLQIEQCIFDASSVKV